MKNKFYLILLGVLLLLGVCFFLFKDIVFYLLVSLVLSTVLSPVVDLIDRIEIAKVKMPRAVGVISAFLLLIGVVSLFTSLFVPLLNEQVAYFKSIDQEGTKDMLSSQLTNLEEYLESIGLWSQNSHSILNEMEMFFVSVIKQINIESVFNNILGTTGSILISALAISFMTFFFLLRKGMLLDLVLKATPNSFFEMMSTALYKIKKLLSNYLLGLLIQMTFVFVLVSVSLSVLGFEYAFTIGVFAALANLVPYVGPFLGILFALIVSITTGVDISESSKLVVLLTKIGFVFVGVQLIDNIGLQPIIFSKSVKAHPLEIFVVIFAGAALAGAAGMILAIPVYTVCRVMFQELSKGIQEYKVFKI